VDGHHDLVVHLLVAQGDNAAHFEQIIKAMKQSKAGVEFSALFPIRSKFFLALFL